MDPNGKQILIIASTGTEAPERCTAPFFFAQTAARQGAKVSLCFILRGAELLNKSVVGSLSAREDGRPLSDFIRLALKSGVQFYVCDASLQACDMKPGDLIEDVDTLVGPSFPISKGMEADLVMSF